MRIACFNCVFFAKTRAFFMRKGIFTLLHHVISQKIGVFYGPNYARIRFNTVGAEKGTNNGTN